MQHDLALLARLRTGDEATFDTLVDRYDSSLRRVARTFVHTPAAAETHAALLRAFRELRGQTNDQQPEGDTT